MFSRQNKDDDTYSSDETGTLKVTPSVPKAGDIPSIIASDLKIVGNLVCGGSVEIEGEVEGNVTCNQVTVRRTGVVKGDVVAESIQIDGEVDGLLKGREVNISETGRVTGVIMYQSLSVRDGAAIDGQCKSIESDSEALKALEATSALDIAPVGESQLEEVQAAAS
jgi:cytoskeletal protein CcmA (bactofilin family)